ncbi:hypothetical protein FRC11_014468 [Ceratobasidium sp. 423]|nr:hypothetical protein FRC11_014468 [Ceratobasidium sp. 423]
MNDEDDHDPYLELQVEFQWAEDDLCQYKMDLNCTLDFTVPMPDEDVEDDEGDMPEELSEDDTDSRSEDDGEGNGGAMSDGKEAAEGDDDAMEGVQPLSEPLTMLDDAELIPGPLVPPASSSASKPQAGAAPFPMSKTLPAKPESDSKPVKAELIKVINKPAQSNKCKAVDEGDQEAGKALSSKKLMMSSSKGQSKLKEGEEEIIDLILDDDDQFVANYIVRKSEGNMASIAFMDYKQKIQCLETKLEDANEKICSLEIQIIELKQKAKLQELVNAELMKCEQQCQLAVHPAPAPTLALAPAPAPAPAAHLNDPFNPHHPFNQPPPW